MATDPMDLIDEAADAGTLENLLQRGIGGTMLAFSVVVIDIIVTAGQVVVQPMSALAGALAVNVDAMFGGPAEVILAGVEATAASILGPFNLGPLSLALAVASVLAAFWVIAVYRDEEDTGNLIPGLPFDVPFIGEQEEDED